MTVKKILIVDDDEAIRDSVKGALELEGYEVLTACHGLDALEQLKHKEIRENLGLIILDLMMPKMSGAEFLDVFTKDPANLKVPVVIATAKGSPVDEKSVPGMIRRLKKPFDLDELYDVVGGYCGRN